MTSVSSNQIGALAPLAVPLPEAPGDQFFTDAQWVTLLAIMDTVIPSVHRESSAANGPSQLAVSDEEYNTAVRDLQENVFDAPQGEALDAYLQEKPSDNPQFHELLKRTLIHYSKDDARKGLAFILSALNTRVGCLMLTGSAIPFHEQPISVRNAILERWRLSYLPPLNGLYKQMTFAGKSLWLKTSPTFHEAAGVPKVPHDYKPGAQYQYEFVQFPAGLEPAIFETDVVIVGSGCGGGVCAKNLAEADNRVLVVDKSYYYPPSQLPMSEESGGIHLFENGGVVATDDGSMPIVAGSTWGGGGTVNWSASLLLQDFVRKEWAQERGLTFFETAEFQSCLDRVCHRMGVSADHIRHNHGNQVLLEGARKLGYHAKAVPQNTAGEEHYCGSCTLGCGAGEKQGPAATWLPDAGKAGAKFVEGFQIEKVLFDESSGTKKAIGVKGTWTSRNSNGGVDGPLSGRTVREVIVKAKKVIISCGTLWSPIVLLNSGLKNYQIGRNLYLHPVNVTAAVFKEDVKPWEGGVLTSVVSSFENLDGHGHGVKLETTCMLPAMFLTLLPWAPGLDYKLRALKLRHTNGFISIARDRDPGRVYPDPTTGLPRVAYTPSAFDRNHILQGSIAVAKMCYVQGATEIHAANQDVKPFIRADSPPLSSSSSSSAADIEAGITDPAFTAWLAELKAAGNKPPAASYACAHQMGSNRMSVSASEGVVDPKGKVWGTEGLYVSDASVFPSASGVNPMVTVMAVSDWISRGVVKELRGGGEARL